MVRTLIGTRIRERRRAQGFTQTGLAQAVGISASYLNLIEHNRRGIAGRTLLSLARELGVAAADLADGSDNALISSLSETAKTAAEANPELDRIEEFVGRYPGWAKLLGQLAQESRTQNETLTALTDRMSQDPFLSETMHQILSNITAIRSTAGILANADDIPADTQQRFLKNLHKDSQRLSDTAQAMVDFFDSEQAPTPITSAVQTDTFVTPDDPAPDPNPQRSPILGSNQSRLQNLQTALPEAPFIAAATSLKFDPIKIASQFQRPATDILLRMAQIPTNPDFPDFGLIEVDMSGAVLHRKQTPEFTLPQYSSACPLWPIYRSFSRLGQVLRAMVEMPSGDRLITYSTAYGMPQRTYDQPPLSRALMIFSADSRVTSPLRTKLRPVLAGLHCAVCPRKDCAQRRADYILA